MNDNELKARIGRSLREVLQGRDSKSCYEKAKKEICATFREYEKIRNRPVDEDVEKRIKDAIKHFLEDAHPNNPGAAIHDAIDHILHG